MLAYPLSELAIAEERHVKLNLGNPTQSCSLFRLRTLNYASNIQKRSSQNFSIQKLQNPGQNLLDHQLNNL